MDMNLRIEQLAKEYRNWNNSFRKKRKEKTDGTDFMDAYLKQFPEDPIASKAEGGIFTHENGTVFRVDKIRRTISLGDVRPGQKILSVRLSTGYLLQVNWDKISDLATCFDAFRPEDVARIMRAISAENYRESKEFSLEQEISETYDKLGKEGKNTL